MRGVRSPALSTSYQRLGLQGQTVERQGGRKLADIKLMKEDPEGVEKTADGIKTRYGKIFGV